MKNFGDQLDEEKLREIFSIHGPITSFKIEISKNDPTKRVACCRFECSKAAEEAVENLNGCSIGDTQLYVARFQSNDERSSEFQRKKDQHQERINKYQGLNLYVKNLDDTIDDERLRKEFSKFGTITSATVKHFLLIFVFNFELNFVSDYEKWWSITRFWFCLFRFGR